MSPSLCCPAAALDIVLLVASHPPRPEIVCLMLDANHRGLSSMVVSNAPNDLVTVARSFCPVLTPLTPVKAIVLASARPGLGFEPTADQQIAFLECRELFHLLEIELIDWFLLDAGHATSLAEATDARTLWRSTPQAPRCCTSPVAVRD
jgi:DNA repair protein RadC